MSPLSSHLLFNIPAAAYAHFKDDSRRNVVAFKGTEVSVAVGSTVRCAELRDDVTSAEGKDKKAAYQVCNNVLCVTNCVLKTFEFPTVRFAIKEVLWNNSGTHLALMGTNELAIISFPRLGLTSHVKVDNIPPKYVIHPTFL
jgi:hypothetical protein